MALRSSVWVTETASNFVLYGGTALALRLGHRAIYGQQYNPVLTLHALSYYGDLSEELPASIKADLLAAVKSVSLQNLPTVSASQSIGEGIRRDSL
jgi:hypothetical protein